MDLAALLRDAWRITRTQPTVWALHALLLVVGLPSVVVSGAFGMLGALREIESPGLPVGILPDLAMQSPGLTAGLWVAGLALVIVFSALTQIVLAAIYRAVASLLPPARPLAFAESLVLGRARLGRIIVLSLTLGAALSALALLPILLDTLGAPTPVTAAMRPLLAPVNLVGGLAFLLLTLAFSLDDVRGREAPGRAWAVFKRGWTGFLLVFALTLVWSLVVGALAVPGIMAVVLVWLWPGAGAVAPLTTGVVVVVCGGPLLVLTLAGAAYTNILQTLVYRKGAEGLL